MGTGQAYSKQHFWDLTPDDHQGARPMKDPQWFALFQPLLVQMANTDYGRICYVLIGIPIQLWS